MKAIIDGDILTYRIGFTTQDLPVEIAYHRMDETVSKIADSTGVDELEVFLTGTNQKCFRYGLYPFYKANRKQPKPLWYSELRAHLVADYGAIVTDELEADDAMGIAQGDDTIICTIDKDLDQVPGKHYDFVKEIAYEVSKEQATRFFYFQLLMGDTTDNIIGIPKVGPKKAESILEGLTTERQYLIASIHAYLRYKQSMDHMNLQGRLIKIRQRKGEPLWDVEREMVRLGVPSLKTRLRRTLKETESNTSLSPST